MFSLNNKSSEFLVNTYFIKLILLKSEIIVSILPFKFKFIEEIMYEKIKKNEEKEKKKKGCEHKGT